MKKNFFMVCVEGESIPTYRIECREKAEEEAIRLAAKFGKEAHVLTQVDTVLPTNAIADITNYEAACYYLHSSPIIGQDGEREKRALAMYKLTVIAEAWNKAEGFTPDLTKSGRKQFSPMFVYDDGTGRFVFSYVDCALPSVGLYLGRICFKTEERAEQFGLTFADLFNDLFQ
jgi:hypothetical protein